MLHSETPRHNDAGKHCPRSARPRKKRNAPALYIWDWPSQGSRSNSPSVKTAMQTLSGLRARLIHQMFPLPKECGAAFRIPMLHLPDKSPCLVAQRPFRPGIGDDLIASRQLALLRPLEAVHPGHERIRPAPHFQQAAAGVRPARRKSPQRRAAVLRTACGSSRTRTTAAPRRRRSPAPLLPARSRTVQDHPAPEGAAGFPTRARPRPTPPTATARQPEPYDPQANGRRGMNRSP